MTLRDDLTGGTGRTGHASQHNQLTDAVNARALLAGPFAPSHTGATAATRYVGGTTSGAPGSGTFAIGDFVIDWTGKVWICTTAGTPGTWTQAGSNVPIPADADGSATATVTPDPVSGAHSMTVIQVAADQAIMAWKIAGDAHPRVIIAASGIFSFGDGTYDPSASGAAVSVGSDGSISLSPTAGPGMIVGDAGPATDRDMEAIVTLNSSTQLATSLPGGAAQAGAVISSQAGSPSGAVGGVLGDIFVRIDGGVGSTIYRCTTSGNHTTAVWTAIL